MDAAYLYARAGRADLARQMLAERTRVLEVDSALGVLTPGREEHNFRKAIEGVAAAAEGRYDDALAHLRESGDTSRRAPWALPDIGRVHDRAGRSDSAQASYETYLAATDLNRAELDARELARVLFRLGEIYEARGDRARAAERYGQFVELWKGADPELQPRVMEAQASPRGTRGGAGRPMSDVAEVLAVALGSHYRIERELGGGGMSRVFVAEEIALRAAAWRSRSCRRSWRRASPPNGSAARSSSPRSSSTRTSFHCSTSDRAAGLVFYLMPYVEGETLRARLARDGACRPTTRCASRAMSPRRSGTPTAAGWCIATSSRRTSCSSSGHAVVLDFGVAKALRERPSTAAAPRRALRSARRSTWHRSRRPGAARWTGGRSLRTRRRALRDAAGPTAVRGRLGLRSPRRAHRRPARAAPAAER